MPVKYRLLVFAVVSAIKSRKFLWLASAALKWLSLNLQIDREKKTWRIVSDRMTDPTFHKVYFTDIDKIIKAKPETYQAYEEKTADGKFKSFVIETV